MGNFQGGIARANITPPIGGYLSGYRLRDKPTRGTHNELWAKALVLDDGNRCIAILTVDLAGFLLEDTIRIRERINAHTGISSEGIMIAASHTHSGPGLGFNPHWPGEKIKGGVHPMPNNAYKEILQDKLVGIAIAAFESRKPVKIGAGKGKLDGVTINRRDPNGPIDPGLSVLRVDSVDGEWSAILVNFTVHALTMGPCRDWTVISPDFIGPMRAFIKHASKKRILTLFTNGAAGNINPWDFYFMGDDLRRGDIRDRYTHTFSVKETQRFGTLVALEALKVFEQTQTTPEGEITVAKEDVVLPIRNRPTVEEAEANVARVKRVLERARTLGKIPSQEKTREDILLERQISCFYPEISTETWGPELHMHYANEVLIFAKDREENKTTEIRTEIQTFTIDNKLAMVAVPCELFVEIGLDIKRECPFDLTFIVGYANDSIGYLPTAKAFREGGYGVTWSSRTNPEAEKIIKATILGALDRCRLKSG